MRSAPAESAKNPAHARYLAGPTPNPPILPPGETAFITFRLYGTTPAAIARELKAAHAASLDYRRAQKSFFAKFDAVLDRVPIGQHYFESEKLADGLAGEIMMLKEMGFVVHGFAILPNHAHLMLHLSASSRFSFALLHQRTEQLCCRLVRPKLSPEAPFW